MAESHRERVEPWVAGFRDRRARGTSHPVDDFLFRYYRYSPGKLEEWHPEPGLAIRDTAVARERFEPPRYVRRDGCIVRDPSVLLPKERIRLGRIRDLLQSTLGRSPHLGCFGMHEWAMVYRGEDIRHRETVPLRLPQEEVDALVDSRPVLCSHYDAFRFFAPSARPLNRLHPTLEDRERLEQPGCVHANMDLYKWSYKSMPWVGTEILWRSFELAVRLRALDMRASPYDLSSLGYEAIAVETEEGRRVYRSLQEAMSEEAQEVRLTLIAALNRTLALAEAWTSPEAPPAPSPARP